MPEYPDIELYLHALRPRVADARLEAVTLGNPFLLRSVEPALDACAGKRVVNLQRLGKRIVFHLEDDLALVLHLMVAGRLQWADKPDKPVPKRALAGFRFDRGLLVLTEAGSKRRASLYVVRGGAGVAAHDPGGLELHAATAAAFAERLTRSNHTLKRALTDPRIFSGIGNAYSDEILHQAGLSPVQLTGNLKPDEIERLFAATLDVLQRWKDHLIEETGAGFPRKVTAFRPEMAVHGKYQSPCPVCGTEVQRIRYASNETNYCPRCQTGGRVLADRALSRLLKKDWPRSIEALEKMRS